MKIFKTNNMKISLVLSPTSKIRWRHILILLKLPNQMTLIRVVHDGCNFINPHTRM